jgi:hypothetical protein
LPHVRFDLFLSDHHELRGIERVGSLAKNFPLWAALPTRSEESVDVLEIGGGDVAGKRLRRRQRLAVSREHVPDLPLRNRDERHFVNAVLERHQDVPAAAEQPRLKPGLAVQRDEPAFQRSFGTPELFDDADAVVRDIAERQNEDSKDEHAEQHLKNK